MIRDGVCDEATNTKRCLFDGGDCCRQNKSVELCNICTCKLELDQDQLNLDYTLLEVVVSANDDDFAEEKVSPVATIDSVESVSVCSRICMDSSTYSFADDWAILPDERTVTWRANVNGWVFHVENKTCSCLSLDCQREDVVMIPAKERETTVTGLHKVLFFVLQSIMVTCSELQTSLYF